MKNINDGVKYRGCEIADDLLSPSIKSWLVKNNFKKTLKVPFRKNGMTSSGYQYQCHQNVFNLVKAYGGKRLYGYAVCIDGNAVQFLSHSVWITPEGNAVDVTPSNDYSDDPSYQHFLPVVEENIFETALFSFILLDEFVDQVILINNLRSNDISDYSRVAMPYFTKSMLMKKKVMSRNELIGMLRIGGFNKPSTSTGNKWSEIFDKKIAPKFA